MRITLAVVAIAVFSACAASAAQWSPDLAFAALLQGRNVPKIIDLGPVKPDLLGLHIDGGHIEYGRQVPYERRPGDEMRREGKERLVFRDGKFLGWLVGKDGKLIYTEDRLVGPFLDTELADKPSSYTIVSSDDPAFSQGLHPAAVYRKTKPSDFGRSHRWPFPVAVEHTLYLRMPRPLRVGARYTIRFADGFLPEQSFTYEPRKMRSEAVHVSQVGFRPDDPAKVAFLSLWAGSAGPIEYREGTRFEVLDDKTGKTVFSGAIKLIHRPGDPEDAYKKDYAGTYVYEMDFSGLRRPGVYRVYVEGVGCSYSFPIADDAWRRAFYVSARGFYHQRSGIALGPPYTDFRRPRPFHPDDGVVVYQSTCPLMYSGNGLNALGTDKNNFGNLVKGKTDKIVANAWGGYMDAGDWDRRIQHLIASRYLLDLAELFPEYFSALNLNIPESNNDLPDVVDEALFNIDFYRRLQTPEGGVRGGIESSAHPRHGECSWQESLTVMAYAPGAWSSYLYAAAAAKAAFVLEKLGRRKQAAVYRESALRAMQWAEKERERMQREGEFKRWRKRSLNDLRDARNLAAADLYRLTGDRRWHDIFLATTAFTDPKAELFVYPKHEQREAAWVYVRTQRPDVDRAVQQNCRNAIIREADERLANTQRTSFRYAKYAWRPGGVGAFSAPDAVSLLRAYLLTGDVKYLRATVLACQTGAGANPLNLCYTTGVGQNWPRHPLHIDSRITHQPPPAGLTVFGPIDVARHRNYWAQKLVARHCYPAIDRWPTLDAYWDVFWYPPVCEFTIHRPMAENAYVWGFLAARTRMR